MRLGRGLHILSQNLLVLRAEKSVLQIKKIEALISIPVFDDNMKEIGAISDIFGPIENPYVVVQLTENQKDVEQLLKQQFYFIPKQKRTKRRKK